MTKPKSDDSAILHRLTAIFYKDNKKLNYDQISRLEEAVDLFNTEKRKWADYVVGSDEPSPSPAIFDDFRPRYARNTLRAEQRKRNV